MKKLSLALVLGLSTLAMVGTASAATAGAASSVVQSHREAVANPVNINTADSDALMKVRGISAKRAAAIIAYRGKHGDFKAVDDLVKVPGFNEKAVKRIHNKITV